MHSQIYPKIESLNMVPNNACFRVSCAKYAKMKEITEGNTFYGIERA